MSNPPISLKEAFEALECGNGSILDLMRGVGLDPQTDFHGGDWRGCRFAGLDLRGCDFRNCRLYGSDFSNCRVAGADFTGADIGNSKLHAALDWQQAVLDETQRSYLLGLSNNGNDLDALRERELIGDILSVWQYVRLMKAARSYSEAHTLYARMIGKGIEPNKHIFTTLIDKCGDFDTSLSLLEQAKALNVDLDEPIYVALMSNAKFKQAKDIFDLVQSLPGRRSTYPFNTLIRKAPSLEEALAVISQMWADGPRPDRISINAALNVPWTRELDFGFATDLISTAIEENVAIAQLEIATLLRRARTAADISRALDLLQRAGLTRNIQIDNALISILGEFENGFENAMHHYYEAIHRGIQPDRHTFYALLKATEKPVQAFQVLAIMRSKGAQFDPEILGMLTARSKTSPPRDLDFNDPAHARPVLQYFIEAWSEPNDQQYWEDQIL